MKMFKWNKTPGETGTWLIAGPRSNYVSDRANRLDLQPGVQLEVQHIASYVFDFLIPILVQFAWIQMILTLQ